MCDYTKETPVKSEQEIIKKSRKMDRDKIILGDGVEYSSDPKITGLNSNIIVIGSSGSGKTYSVLEPCLLEAMEKNKIVVVTKRRVAEMYMPLLEERGYRVYDLNFAMPSLSNCAYDPLYYIRNDDDISALAESIVMANERRGHSFADPFWDDSARSLLTAEIAVTLMRKDNATFSDVIELHNRLQIKEGVAEGIATSLDDLFHSIEAEENNCLAIRCWKTFKTAPATTARCIYSSMNTIIDKLFAPCVCEMIENKPPINFNEVATEKSVIFVTTSPVKKSLHCLANMFMSQAVTELFEFAESRPDGKLPIAMDIYFDDFATGCRVAAFPEQISIFREKQISCMLLLQSYDQLHGMYGGYDANTIIDNCDTMVYMGGNNLTTAINISQRLNEPLEDVLYMGNGTEFIFRRGQRPIKTTRYSITKNDEWKQLQEVFKKNNESITNHSEKDKTARDSCVI